MLQRDILDLRKSFENQVQEMRRDVGRHLESTGGTLSNLQKDLGALGESMKKVKEITGEIRRLEDILAPPKMRGQVGETLLENLIREVLPPQVCERQYQFSSGVTADMVVRVGKRILVIDAKFPLDNFNRAITPDLDEKTRDEYWKRFVSDVKKQIDQIQKKYIRPSEGTMDFALMYIPAEGVYYEAFVKDTEEPSLLGYAHERDVIPVSPSTLYAYLQVILYGLRGFQLEEKAEAILNILRETEGNLKNLGELLKSFNSF